MLSVALLLAAIAPFVYGAPSVQLGKATVVGLSIPTLQQESFAGIPFAEPPLGSLRLKPPVLKATPDAGTFNATAFGDACLQLPQLGTSPPSMSEDCLTINVLRPAGTPAGANLPVLFWTYGGGFEAGFSEQFNASVIVAQSVLRGTPLIYVNFNYRLGPLGFPQGQEAADKGALNLALKDQLAALEWVQLNIGAFGGDKTKVTVFGESAGSIMTSILFLNSPLPKLARGAIFESGSQASAALFFPQRRQSAWQNFVAGVSSCASLATSSNTFACLQSPNTSTAEIFAGLTAAMEEATEEFPWDPVLDGPGGLIPELPSVLFARGEFARLPFMAGTNQDEGTIFTPQATNSTEEVAASFIAMNSPSVAPALLNASIAKLLVLYPDDPALGSPFGTGNQTFGLSPQFKRAAAIATDLDFLSQRRFFVDSASRLGVPTFAYLFTQPQVGVPPSLGVEHGSEIAFVYGAPADTSASAVALARVMTDYWVSFATSLTPNDGKGIPRPEWTQHTPANQAVIQLNGANLTMIPDNFRLEQTNFFNSDPIIWRH
ncbi:extracellular triacylglycerol lipase precursor [Roridomyces roridus]|uniref:Carboxylic ester hydrolase n=1 Tax=Roridomyces roridus TaxID=1738132 RepID=A0AAD7FDN8_9AGAR|nr:extracellular triacylglycerol lipase precursor [Roridomyces roridus]